MSTEPKSKPKKKSEPKKLTPCVKFCKKCGMHFGNLEAFHGHKC